MVDYPTYPDNTPISTFRRQMGPEVAKITSIQRLQDMALFIIYEQTLGVILFCTTLVVCCSLYDKQCNRQLNEWAKAVRTKTVKTIT